MTKDVIHDRIFKFVNLNILLCFLTSFQIGTFEINNVISKLSMKK